METPQSILKNEPDYKPKAWQEYSLQELGNWVHLLVKRSRMPSNNTKRFKDLGDAQEYLNMMQAHINDARALNEKDLQKS